MSTPSLDRVVAAVPEEVPVAIEMLADAFADDAITNWIYPDVALRRPSFTGYCAHMLSQPSAAMQIIDDCGAAIWLTVDAADESSGPEETTGPEVSASGRRLMALGDTLAAWHPRERRYRYLFAMGVRPGRQGGGHGSALLARGIADADAVGLGVYLEASSANSRMLYRRHGFEDLAGSLTVEDSPPIWPMWRPPQSAPIDD